MRFKNTDLEPLPLELLHNSEKRLAEQVARSRKHIAVSLRAMIDEGEINSSMFVGDLMMLLEKK